VLNTCKVVNRKFDTGISYRIEALGAEKKGKERGRETKKKYVELCVQRENGRAGPTTTTMTGIFTDDIGGI